MDIKLTDDELGALSSLTAMTCPLPTITIDINNAEQVRQVIARGHRSLKVRDLLSEEAHFQAPIADLAKMFTDISRSPQNLLLFVSRGDSAGYIGMGLAAIPMPDRVILDEMSPDGIHDMRNVTSEAALDHITGWIQDFLSAPPKEDASDVGLTISSSGGATAFKVLPGSVSQGWITVDEEESRYVQEHDLGTDTSSLREFVNEALSTGPEPA